MSTMSVQTKPKWAFRKGRHTVILGWSALAIEVIREIAVANQNKRGSKIVILPGQPREAIANQLLELRGKLGKTQLYIQVGEPTDTESQALINIAGSKSIIDFSTDLIQISGPTAHPVLVHENELTAGLRAQVAKHSSMSAAIGDLLNFDGEEIYFNSLPALTGKTYADAILAFNTASVIGLVDSDGLAHLNPSQSSVIGPETLVIAIAEDDDKVVYTGVREDIAMRVYEVGAAAVALTGKGAQGTDQPSVEHVIPKFIAQVSENLALAPILYELLSTQGASVNINSIESYVNLEEDVEFAELAAIASAHGQSAIGFLAGAASGEPHGGVWLNPPKNTVFRAVAGDGLVVVSASPR